MNIEVKDNADQTVGGSLLFDQSNIIGEGRECDDE